MNLHQPDADIFIPDRLPVGDALARTTHLAIGAHQDDLEFFAYHGIEACYGSASRWFTGVTCTDGSGSARSGPYAGVSDGDMMSIRAGEQRKAAVVGDYAAMIQLGYPSAAIKDPSHPGPLADLSAIVEAARPRVAYLHNPADKHDTHVAALLRSLEALRRLPADARPEQVWGCEIWRGLDWLLDEDKGVLPVSARPNLQGALNGIFDSQIMGGKRYDLAIMGRRISNATFFESHACDTETGLTFAIDLTPLVADPELDIVDFTTGLIERLRSDVENRLRKFA